MRKIFATAALIIFGFLASYTQPRMEVLINMRADSLRKILPFKKGIERIDCLNALSFGIIKMWYDETPYLGNSLFDTVFTYSTQAVNESKKIKYKRGLGYANLRLAQCEVLRYDMDTTGKYEKQKDYFDLSVRYANEAILIGKELGDNFLIGNCYRMLASVEANKNNTEQRLYYLNTAISYHEKFSNGQQGTYHDIFTKDCNGCKGNEFLLGELFFELSSAHNDIAEINSDLQKAIEYFLKGGEKSSVGSCYFRLGNVISIREDLESGIEIMKKAIPYFQESGNSYGELNTLNRICGALWSAGDFENGFEYSKKSVQLIERRAKEYKVWFAKSLVRGQAYYWLGRFYSIAGDNETALQWLRISRNYFPDNGSVNQCLIYIGEIHRQMGNFDSAMYYLYPLAIKGGGAKIYLSNLYNSMKQYDKALPLIKEMVEITKQRNNQVNLGYQYNILARAYFGTGDIEKALSTANEAHVVLKRIGRNVSLIDNCQILSEIFNKIGKYDSAFIYLRQYTALKDSLLDRQFFIRLNDYKKQAEEEKKTSQINLLNKDNQLAQQKLKQEATLKKGLIIGLILLLLLAIFIYRNLSQKRKNDLEKQKLENQKKQTELEMQALRAQMNPHFIFNCLSSINRFILKNESKIASNYLTRFSRLMRMVLNNSQKSLIALEDELEMLELYLEMERLRFKNSFDYGITYLNKVDSDNIFIPPLLLQPFCENAIWHGLMNKEGLGRLDVELSMEDKILNCVIRDNGVGREKAEEMKSKTAEKEKSMGLKITTERLTLLNKEKGLHTFYEIEDLKDENGNPGGTKVILKILVKASIEELA